MAKKKKVIFTIEEKFNKKMEEVLNLDKEITKLEVKLKALEYKRKLKLDSTHNFYNMLHNYSL